ncbi:3-oxoadipate enol-lactonase [Roseovarius pacificus]|uniref:3-oxoadipate enol-lactonase n=1 Tax=Roseovarius pacificus TaxID=337701 RepID=A0A1M7A3J3_9RHOB|nr:alpha/beta fold hydrolase [Roseovarius pacificus]GGO53947.1 lactone hydrolase [Roseovarius pacificus]SHL37103.1 3-oxoadipate enol-lactonase [Roseovarius pacificus]
MNASTSRSITANDGTPIVFETIGNGPDKVALCHSLAMDRNFWMPVAERLEKDATVLIWDARGHGQSGKPAGPYTVELFADDLAAIFEALNWQDAIVCGASMGGCVSLAFADRHASKLRGLGLFDTTAWYGATAESDWAGRAQKARTEGLAALVDFQVTRWFTDDFRAANPHIVDMCVKAFLANDPGAYSETCLMLGRADVRSALPNIDVPVQIAVGREDYATPPEMARALHEAIPASEMEIIERGRHLTPLEHPDLIAGYIRKIIERTQS